MFRLGFVMTFVGIFESLAISVNLPLIQLVLGVENMQSNEYYIALHHFVGQPGRGTMILGLSIFAIFALVASVCLSLFVHYRILRFGADCWARLSSELIRELIDTPYEWFLSKNSSVITRLLLNDIPLWSRDFTGQILSLTGDLVTFALLLAVVAWVFPVTGFLVAILAFFAGLALFLLCGPKVKHYSTLQRQVSDALMVAINRILVGIKCVKVSENKENFLTAYEQSVNNLGNATVWVRFWNKVYPLNFVGMTQIGLVLVTVLFWHVGFSASEIGVFLALAMLISARLVPAVNRIIGAIGGLVSVGPFVRGIHELREELNLVRRETICPSNSEASSKSRSRTGAYIEFVDVSFRYKGADRITLQNINLSLKKGCVYGLAGASGAGKTTLVDILLGLLTPTKGSIFVYGDLLNADTLKDWQRTIGYVPQSPFMIDGTLAENVAFCVGREKIQRARILENLKLAQLDTFVAGLSNGIDTPIGDLGAKISGGEKQRVSVARALFQSPLILILDEATSGLDQANEQKIIDTITTLKGHVTTVFVAHRSSVFSAVDEVIFLESGRISEIGPFEELRKKNSKFADLFVSNK